VSLPCFRGIAVAVALVLAVAGATAATLDVSNGERLGAFGVDVGGALYDVAFADGTCIALFSVCYEPSDFTFTTLPSAHFASRALMDQVLIDGGPGSFDSIPQDTHG
jgi:hypothetical protein